MDPLSERRHSTKELLAGALRACGGFNAIRWLSGHSPRILLYHRFAAVDTARALGADTFRRQMLFLRERFRITSLAEILVWNRARQSIPRNVVAITIDDGYADFYHHAFPILQDLAIPATFYVTTEFIDGRVWLWPDRIAYALDQATRPRLTLELGVSVGHWELENQESRIVAWSDIADHCLALGPEGTRTVIADLACALQVNIPEVPPPEYQAASWAQIREMADAGIEIGSHTRTHPRLSLLSDEAVRVEIEGSKHDIEAQLSRPVTSFAYPHGRSSDFDERCRMAVRIAGYSSAMAGTYDPEVLRDPFGIKRLGISKDWGAFLKSTYGIRHLRERLPLPFRR